MRVGLNGQKLLIEHLAGPEIYTLNVFKALANMDNENSYVVYFDKQPTDKFWEDLKQQNSRFSYKVISTRFSWTQIGLALELLRSPVDIFFTAVHTIPVLHNPRLKIISVIHGLEFKANKQYQNDFLKGLIHPLVLWWTMIFSKIVIAPSVSTKESIIKLKWPFIDKDKIKIITEGVSKEFYKRTLEEIKTIKEKYNLDKSEYLIFVSTIQPRKNIPKMIEGFSIFIKRNPKYQDLKLVISGKNGWQFEESLVSPKKFGVENNVMFVGRTPDEDLPVLLSGAKAFISCSLEEGFGLPLLEAMACEIPCVISDIPAFRELGREFQIYVNPNNEISIQNGIEKVLTDNSIEKNIKEAKEASKEYSWDKVALSIVKYFKNEK